MSEKPKKYYAVRVGRIPGIYVDWPNAKKQVVDFPGAKYKSFTDKESAIAFLEGEKSEKVVKTTKYYAIKKGREPGIYTNWTQAKKQIDGYPGAIYKSFTDKESAEEFMEVIPEKSGKKVFKPDIFYIFTDGSHNRKTKKSAFGYYMPTIKKIVAVANRETNNWNEIWAIIEGLRFVLDNEIEETTIGVYSDSEYAIKLIWYNYPIWKKTGEIKDTLIHRELMGIVFDIISDLDKKGKKVVLQHVRAHTGNLDDYSIANDVVDKAVQRLTS